MRFEGALIREQGVEFAVVIVKPPVVQSQAESTDTIEALQVQFGVPVTLMAQDVRGTPTYCGRPDIVRLLSTVPLAAIPWREYTFN